MSTLVFNSRYLNILKKRSKLTQKQIGEKVNLDTTTLSNLFLGKNRNPRPETVQKLADFFKQPADKFWTEDKKTRATLPVDPHEAMAKVADKLNQESTPRGSIDPKQTTEAITNRKTVLVEVDKLADGALLVKDSKGKFYRATEYK